MPPFSSYWHGPAFYGGLPTYGRRFRDYLAERNVESMILQNNPLDPEGLVLDPLDIPLHDLPVSAAWAPGFYRYGHPVDSLWPTFGLGLGLYGPGARAVRDTYDASPFGYGWNDIPPCTPLGVAFGAC